MEISQFAFVRLAYQLTGLVGAVQRPLTKAQGVSLQALQTLTETLWGKAQDVTDERTITKIRLEEAKIKLQGELLENEASIKSVQQEISSHSDVIQGQIQEIRLIAERVLHKQLEVISAVVQVRRNKALSKFPGQIKEVLALRCQSAQECKAFLVREKEVFVLVEKEVEEQEKALMSVVNQPLSQIAGKKQSSIKGMSEVFEQQEKLLAIEHSFLEAEQEQQKAQSRLEEREAEKAKKQQEISLIDNFVLAWTGSEATIRVLVGPSTSQSSSLELKPLEEYAKKEAK